MRMRFLTWFLSFVCVLVAARNSFAETCNWTNASGGNWNTASNWSCAAVPGAADDAVISLSGAASYTVTLDVTPVTVNSLTLGASSGATTQTLSINSKTLNINSPSFINAKGILSLTSATLNGPGSLDNAGTLNAYMVNSISGALTTQPTSAITISSFCDFNCQNYGSRGVNGYDSNLTISGDFTNNGSISLTHGGGYNAFGISTLTGATLTNAGTITSAVGDTYGSRVIAAALNNTATLDINYGLTVNKASGQHTNSGTINANANLTLTQSGTSPSFTNSGSISVASGKTFTVSGGAFNHNSGGTLSGAGAVAFSGTTPAINLNADFTYFVASLTLTGATVNGPGKLINLAGSPLSITSSIINAPFDNAGTLNAYMVNSISGALTTQATSAITISSFCDFNCQNYGSRGVNGYDSNLSISGDFTNNGSISLTHAGGYNVFGISTLTGATITNAGTITSAVGDTFGSRVIAAELNNQNLLTTTHALTINRASAQHSNSGTINTNANLTLTQSSTSPSFTNSGAINVASGKTLTVSGGAFNHNSGGTLSGAGAVAFSGTTPVINLNADFTYSVAGLTLTGTTVNGPGKLINPVGSPLSLWSSIINAPFDNAGTLNAYMGNSISGALTTQPTSAITISSYCDWNCYYYGDRSISHAYDSSLTTAASFTNSGSINLTHAGGYNNFGTSTVGISPPSGIGTLTNTGTINSVVGDGVGGRVIAAELNNQNLLTTTHALTINKSSGQHTNSGTIKANANLTLTQSGTSPAFTNSGAITVAGGKTLTVSGGAFNQNSGGTLSGVGTLSLNSLTAVANSDFQGLSVSLSSSTMTINVPSTIYPGATMNLTNSTIKGSGSLANSGILTLTNSTIETALTNGGALNVYQGNTVSGALSTLSSSAITISSFCDWNCYYYGDRSAAHAYDSSLTTTADFANNGSINLTHAGGYNNFGTSTVGVSPPSGIGTLTNAGTINSAVGDGVGGRVIAAELNNRNLLTTTYPLTISKASAQHVNSGTITASDNLTVSQSGSAPTFTNSGAITIASGKTLTVSGGAFSHSSGSLTGTGALTLNSSTSGVFGAAVNLGTLNLTSVPSAVFGSGVQVGNLNLTGSILTLSEDLSAGSSISLNSSTLKGSGRTVTNASGKTLTLTNSTIETALANGGTMNVYQGNTVSGVFTTLSSSAITLGSFCDWNCYYYGDRSLAHAYDSNLTTTANFTNNGSISLTHAGGYNNFGTSTIAITPPSGIGTLTNAGTINSLVGDGLGSRIIAAELNNQNLLTTTYPLTINKASAQHQNSGTIDIVSSKTLTVSGGTLTNSSTGIISGTGSLSVSGSTFSNAGIITPATAGTTGTLGISGAQPDTASAVTNIDIGGTAAGQFDVLAVSGVAILNGTLTVNLIDTYTVGYTPVAGNSFKIMTFTSKVGSFGTINLPPLPADRQWTVSYNSGDITLNVVANIAPTITATNIGNNSTAIPIGSIVTASFSEPMDGTTFTGNFTLTYIGGAVAGVVSFNSGTNTATFTPAANLANGTVYTATITTGAMDLAGNPLAADYTWSFTTETLCGAVPSGLVGWWKGDGSGGDQMGANSGTLLNGATFAQGKVGQAFSFNGNSSYVKTGNISLAGSFTIGTWIYVNNLNKSQTVVSKELAGVNWPSFGMAITAANKLQTWFGTANSSAGWGTPVAGDISITSGWHYVVGTYDGSNIRLYVDGILDKTIARTGAPFPSTDVVTIGASNGGTPVNYFDGKIDEPQIYSRALSDAEIQSIFSAGSSGICDVLRPMVTIVTPSNNAALIPVSTTVTATFSDGLNAATLDTATTFTLKDDKNSLVTGTITFENLTRIATFTPAANLTTGMRYTATITTGVTDLAGNALTADYSWSFTTRTNSVAVPNGLVSMWKGEGNATDETGLNNATFNGTVAYSAGIVGQAFSLNGTNAHLSVTASSSLDVGTSNGFSIDAWINPTDITTQRPIAEWNSGTYGTHFWINVSGQGTLFANIVDTAGASHTITSATGLITPDSYQHVALTYDKTNGATVLYLNGVAVTSQNLGVFTPRTNWNLLIGNRTTNYFSGQIDELKLYNRTLSIAEIQAIYNAAGSGTYSGPGVSGVTPANGERAVPVGTNVMVIFNEAMDPATISDGTFILKGSDNIPVTGTVGYLAKTASFTPLVPLQPGTYTATISGGASGVKNPAGAPMTADISWTFTTETTCVAEPAGLVGWWKGDSSAANLRDPSHVTDGTLFGGATYTAGKVGQAFSFNGTSGYVAVNDNTVLDLSTTMTLAAWINPADVSTYRQIISKFGSNSSNYSYMVGLSPGSLRSDISGDGTTYDVLTAPISANVWQHVATTFNAGVWKLYINGVEAAAKVSSITSLKVGTEPLYIGGRRSISQFFSGLIDEAQIYNTALSAAEIAAIYNAGTNGTCTGATTYDVTPLPVTNGSVSPGIKQTVSTGTRAYFALTPASFYGIDTATVGGSCPAGIWNGSQYITGAITADCTVQFNFSALPAVNGQCGSASSAIPVTAKPASNLCTFGTPSTVRTLSTAWQWDCLGTNIGHTDEMNCSVPIKSYAVDFTAGSGGKVSSVATGTVATLTQTINHGSSVAAATAIADPGYHFVNWTEGATAVSTSASYTPAAITAPHSFTANFRNYYILTPSTGSGGSITPATAQNIAPGATRVFTVTPNPHYHIVSAFGCGGSWNTGDNTVTTTAAASDCTVSATFAIDSFAITTQVLSSSGSVSCPASAGYGTSPACTFSSPGYHLSALTDNGVNVLGSVSGNSYTIATITAPHAVAATFVPNSYVVTSTAGTGGGIAPSGTQTVTNGQSAGFSVTPDPGYRISNVSGCGGSAYSNPGGLTGGYSYSATITGTCSVSASFSLIPGSIAVTAPKAGEGWQPGSSHAISWTSTGITTVRIEYSTDGSSWNLIATPPAADGSYTWAVPVDLSPGQYQIRIKNSDALPVASSTVGSITIQADVFTVIGTAGAGGSITPTTPRAVTGGANASFSITPAAGFVVDTNSFGACTTGSLTGSSSPFTYTTGAISADCAVSISFRDTDAPAVAITAPLNNSHSDLLYQISGTASDVGGGIDQIEVHVTDGVNYLAAANDATLTSAAPVWLTATGTTSWGLPVAGSLPYADYTFSARAIDKGGNSSAVAAITFTKAPRIVQAYTTMDLNLSSYTILTTDTITASGKLTRLPVDGTSLRNLPITLTLTSLSDASVQTYNTATSDDFGHYEFTGIPTLPKDTYNVKASFAGDSSLADCVSETKKLLVGSTAGYAVLVVGKIAGNEGMASHHKTANRVYHNLKARGFDDANITYLHYQTAQELAAIAASLPAQAVTAGDMGEPSKAAIQAAISAASVKMQTAPAPLYLIMIDHGSQNAFHVNSETITPADVKGWLDGLDVSLAGFPDALSEKRFVMIGSCYSGSFIPTVAKAGRVVITSASGDEESYKGPNEKDGIRSGEYFMEAIFSTLERGNSYKASFEDAAAKIYVLTRMGRQGTVADLPLQHPRLNDTGFGTGSVYPLPANGDGASSKALFLGAGQNFNTNSLLNPADITAVTPTINLNTSTTVATLWAIANSGEVSSAWVEIRTPSMTLAMLGRSEQPAIPLFKYTMTLNNSTNRWEYTHNAFTEEGAYEIFYYVLDAQTGKVSPMQRSLVNKQVYVNQTPNAFALLAPPSPSEQKGNLIFSWNETTDPENDSISYTLIISKQLDFSTIDYRLENVAGGLAVVGPEGGLQDLTTYYWKVQAIDSHFGIRDSEVRSFFVNNDGGIPFIITGKVSSSAGGNQAIVGAVITAGSVSTTSRTAGTYAMQLPIGQSVINSVNATGFDTLNTIPAPTSGRTVQTLNIGLSPTPPPPPVTHKVTPSVSGSGGSISPSGQVTVVHGSTTSFTLQPNAGKQISSVTSSCGGSRSGSTFTTGAVNSDCTVEASFSDQLLTITASYDSNRGSMACPSSAVAYGSSQFCTITPKTADGYYLSALTDNGYNVLPNFDGTQYMLNSVTTNHTVQATFSLRSYLVTPTGAVNGVITPAEAQAVSHGLNRSFTFTAGTGYRIPNPPAIDGASTCPAGSFSAPVKDANLIDKSVQYTTGVITGNCTVIPLFEVIPNSIVLTSPNGGQFWRPSTATVSSSYPVTWISSSNISTVAIDYNCDGGAWLPVTASTPAAAGSYFWTIPIGVPAATTCRVQVTNSDSGAATPPAVSVGNFTIDGNYFTVTPSAGGGGSISPSLPVGVASANTTQFNAIPLTGYSTEAFVSDCGGTRSGNAFVIAGATRDCSIQVTFKDTSIPTVAIAAPANNSQLEHISLISGSAADAGSGLDRVEVQVTNGVYFLTAGGTLSLAAGWVPATLNITGGWTLPLVDANLLADTYTIRARSFDQAGNVSSTVIRAFTKVAVGQPAYTELALDLSDPSVLNGATISAAGKLTRLPDNGSNLQGLDIVVTVTAPDTITKATYPAKTYSSFGHFLVPTISGFTQEGLYTVTAEFAGTGQFAASTSVIRTVLAGSSAGYAIIVQGKVPPQGAGQPSEGEASHTKTANRIFKTLKARGFADGNIRYLSYQTAQEAAAAGVIVNGAPSKTAIQSALGYLAGRMDGNPASFYLIMVDHGGNQKFYLDNDFITPDDLNGWLNTFEASLDATAIKEKRVIIDGSCYSGTFIDALSKSGAQTATATGKPVAAGRIVITSASASEESYKGPNEPDGVRSGEFFLEELFKNLGRGLSLSTSFVNAQERTRTFTRMGGPVLLSYDGSVQHPLIDDDGDQQGSTLLSTFSGDGLVAESVYLGVGSVYDPATSLVADVATVNATIFLDTDTSSATIWSTSSNNARVSSSWVEIRPPSLILPVPGSSTITNQVDLNLDREFLIYNPASKQWEFAANQYFTENGMYELFFFVKDFFTQEISPTKRSVVYRNKTGNRAPAPFALLAPIDGSQEYTTLFMEWGASSDPDSDPFSYTVLVSTDQTFQDAASVRRIEVIKGTNVGIGAEFGLKDATSYYWKVQAIDTFGAMTESPVWSFMTNNTNADSYYVTGKVVDALTNTAVATPQILVDNGIRTYTAFASSDGSYTTPNLGRPGPITISAAAGGYQSNVRSLTVTNQGAITTVTQHFSLTPAGGGSTWTVSTPPVTGGTVFCSNPVVPSGATTTCTISPDTASGYVLGTISGCGGSNSGGIYTTGAIIANCSINATFVKSSYTVTSQVSGGGGTLTPAGGSANTSILVQRNFTKVITVSPDSGYHVNTINGCGGALTNATTFTTGAIVDNCTVAATFAPDVQSQSISFSAPASKTYGDAALTLSASATSSLPVSFTLVSGPATLTGGNTITISGVGSIIVRATQAGNSNYSAAASVEQTIVVSAKALTVTANNTSRAYAAANPASPGSTAPGLVGTDSISSVTYTYQATATATAAVGTTHSITPGAAVFGSGSAANYSISYAAGTLTIAGTAGQSISFSAPASKTYGDAALTLSASATSSLPVSFTLVSGPATLSGSNLSITGVGSIVVRATQAGNSNYSAAATVEQTIVVSAKALIITANSASRAYGAANPANPGFTAPGLIGTDSISSVTCTYQATATATAAVGSTHSITPSAAVFGVGSGANYSITYAAGTLTIAGTAGQSISFSAPASKIYGDPALTLSASATSNLPVSFTLVSGPATLSGSSLSISGAGSIIVRATQAGNSNYAAATAVDQTIVVSAKALTVTASNASRAYATANPANPGFTAPGLVSGEAITSLTYSYQATATPTAAVGTTHSITPSAAVFGSGSASNYTISYVAGTLTIAGTASQSISFSAPFSKTYGDAAITLSATATSNLPVSFTLVSGPATLTGGNTISITGAGSIVVRATQAGNSNYAAATAVEQTIVVSAKPLTVTANNVSRAYSAANPASPGFTAPGLVGSDSISSVTYSYQATATATAAVGTTHSITPGAAVFGSGSGANYSITYAAGTLTIAGTAGQTISFSAPASKTYGDPALTLSVSATSNLPVSFTLVSGPATITAGNTINITGVGNIVVRATQAGNSNYSAATPIDQTMVVSAKALTITANSASRAFGAVNPASPGFTAPGLIGTDSIGSVTYTYQATATATAAVGTTHSIMPGAALFGSGSAANYSISYAAGTLTIAGTAGQSIIFNAIPEKVYGALDFSPNATATTGLPVSYTSSNPGVATIVNNNIHVTGVGTSTITATQTGDANYSSATATQALTVDPALLNVTANNAAGKTGQVSSVQLNASYSGFVNGDTASILSGSPLITTTATDASPAGSYPITATQGSLSAANYTFAFVDGTLAVGLSSQTITFGTIPARTYGASPLDLNALATGGASGNLVTFAVSGPGSLSGTVLTITGAGSIVITASQAGNGSYASTAAQQTLSVNPAILTVTADNLTRAHGVTNPALTYTISGYVNGDNDTVLSGTAPALSTGAIVGSETGSYPIIVSPGSLSAANYTFTFVNGTLAVGLAGQNVTFDALPSAVYGDVPLTLSAIASSNLPVSFSSSNPAVAMVSDNRLTIVGAGNAIITATQVGDASHASAFAQQTVIVSVKVLTLTANDSSRAYAAINPTNPGFTVTGLVSGDTISSVTYTYASSASTSADVGSTHSITPGAAVFGTGSAANYSISSVAGTLTIDKAPADVTLSTLAQVYDGTSKPVTVTTVPAGLPVAVTYNGGVTVPSAIGSYEVAAAVVSNFYTGSARGVLVIALVDNTPPLLTLSTLADGAVTNNAMLNVSGTATAQSGVLSVTVNGVAVSVNQDGTFSRAVTLSVGANTITTVATSNAGLSTSVKRTITLAQTAPLLTVSIPSDNSLTNRSFTSVGGSVSESSNVNVSLLENGANQAVALNGGLFIATVELQSGINTISITATDLAGNTSQVKRTVIYDNQAPTLAITYPGQDIILPYSSYLLKGSVNDALSQVTIVITHDGQSYTPTVTNGMFEQSIGFTASDKQYAVTVTATDQAGNAASVQRNIVCRTLSVVDALRALMIDSGAVKTTAEDHSLLDVAPLVDGKPHPDGVIDISDVVVLLRYSVGLLSW